jgi:hypothetical protein
MIRKCLTKTKRKQDKKKMLIIEIEPGSKSPELIKRIRRLLIDIEMISEKNISNIKRKKPERNTIKLKYTPECIKTEELKKKIA